MMADQVRILGEIRDSINQRMPTLEETRSLRERSENIRVVSRWFNFTRSAGAWLVGAAAAWALLTGRVENYIRSVSAPQQHQNDAAKK